MILGFYVPPANTWWAVLVCVILDYLLAFTAIGSAQLFARILGKHRIAGYAVGIVSVCFIRFVASFLSGVVLWGSYAPEGMNVWIYSLIYNGSYMLPTTILSTILCVALCAAIDPQTLRPMKKN